MKEHPLNKTVEEVIKDLRSGIEAATLHLQQGMQEYLTNIIDLPSLLKMVQKMGIANLMGIQAAPMPGLDYYQILGLNKTASNDEVKQRYLEIMNKLHPDKAGDKMTFLATLVNTAYGMIKKERGI